jgi:hypothetical protein
MMEAMTSGIHERGKGQRGDKTMLDAWLPATEDAMKALSNGALLSIHGRILPMQRRPAPMPRVQWSQPEEEQRGLANARSAIQIWELHLR